MRLKAPSRTFWRIGSMGSTSNGTVPSARVASATNHGKSLSLIGEAKRWPLRMVATTWSCWTAIWTVAIWPSAASSSSSW